MGHEREIKYEYGDTEFTVTFTTKSEKDTTDQTSLVINSHTLLRSITSDIRRGEANMYFDLEQLVKNFTLFAPNDCNILDSRFFFRV